MRRAEAKLNFFFSIPEKTIATKQLLRVGRADDV